MRSILLLSTTVSAVGPINGDPIADAATRIARDRLTPRDALLRYFDHAWLGLDYAHDVAVDMNALRGHGAGTAWFQERLEEHVGKNGGGMLAPTFVSSVRSSPYAPYGDHVTPANHPLVERYDALAHEANGRYVAGDVTLETIKQLAGRAGLIAKEVN